MRNRTTRAIICFLVTTFLGLATGALSHPFHPDRVLVMPRNPAEGRTLASTHASRGRKVLRVFDGLHGLQVVQPAGEESIEQTIAACRASCLVSWAEPDFQVTAAASLPNDPYFQNGTQWWLNNYGQNGGMPDADLDAPEAWEVLHAASNVVVAVVDSGVRPTHEDLAENLWRNPADGTPGLNALTGQHDPWDDNGHGTHLAGIIGAVGNNGRGIAGLTWRTQVMACKFLDAAGNGYISDAVVCIEFARQHGAHVLNLSWGNGEFSAALSNALAAARADGIAVAAAAGNNAANLDLLPYYPASLVMDNIVAVGASTRTDEPWIFSSYGNAGVHLFAPGVAIYSTSQNNDSSYQTRDGTSMAAACVAGTLALMRQRWPGAPVDALRTRLLASVDPKSALSGKCVTGGRLNLRKAIDQPALGLAWSNQLAQITAVGVPGHSYSIAASTNLNNWVTLCTFRAEHDSRWFFADSESTNFPLRFYRAAPGP